jgi:molybdopterin-containing oxidoreductase family membrane subunit
MVGFGISFVLLSVLMVAVTYLLVAGVGIWGINVPVGWGFAINFVWWVGIGHAGTLISAILLCCGNGGEHRSIAPPKP